MRMASRNARRFCAADQPSCALSAWFLRSHPFAGTRDDVAVIRLAVSCVYHLTMLQVIWFKRDLRTIDHRPLVEAAARGPVLPLYIVEPGYWALPDTSRRQWVAIRAALEELSTRLEAFGAPLLIRVGEASDVLRDLHTRHRIGSIHAHEETGNDFTYRRDRAVHALCREVGIAFQEYRQFGVFRRLKDRNQWARLHRAHMMERPLAEPTTLTCGPLCSGDTLPSAAALGLAPDGCDAPQPGTRAEALRLLDSFFAGRGASYRRAMSSPLGGEHACSRLSVPLSTGALSLREALHRCFDERQRLANLPPSHRTVPLTAIDSLIARLHWHCHFIQKLESEPALEWRAQHALHEARRNRTAPDDAVLEAWATGRTGLPFVDACMRSLVATGWLNFRMRAMVQAIASYHLALDWQASGTRLARLFTDYEPGIHWPQVQMQSGQTGINIPRIYNPVKQGLDQDPDGVFTRRWVPELAQVPPVFLQEPWRMDINAQRRAGCILGVDYPTRIVDHETAAREARARLSDVRKTPGYGQEAKRVFAQHGSRKRQATRAKAGAAAKSEGAQPAANRQLTLDL
jgi:deoxyribodipyrimidine photo-lyase